MEYRLVNLNENVNIFSNAKIGRLRSEFFQSYSRDQLRFMEKKSL